VPAGVPGPVGEPDPGLLTSGISRPAPQPDAAKSIQRRAAAVRRGSRCRRRVIRLSGNRAASHRTLFLLKSRGDKDDVVATPVRIVTETVVVLPRATLAGVMLHVALAGMPLHTNVTVPETFAADVRSNGKTAFWPVAMVTLVLPSGPSIKSTPLPVS